MGVCEPALGPARLAYGRTLVVRTLPEPSVYHSGNNPVDPAAARHLDRVADPLGQLLSRWVATLRFAAAASW